MVFVNITYLHRKNIYYSNVIICKNIFLRLMQNYNMITKIILSVNSPFNSNQIPVKLKTIKNYVYKNNQSDFESEIQLSFLIIVSWICYTIIMYNNGVLDTLYNYNE